MHPDDETVHPLNPHAIRAEQERLNTQSTPVIVPLPAPVSAFADRKPTALPTRYRRGTDSLGRIAAGFGVGSFLVILAWAFRGWTW